VIVTTSSDNAYTINFGEAVASIGSGFSGHQRGPNVILTRELLGDLITAPIFGFMAVASVYNVTEVCET
jgi:hypothetical protein